MIEPHILDALQDRMGAAQKRYGHFASSHEALGAACEEWHELIDAVRSNRLADVASECLDLAAVCLRLAQDVGRLETANRSVK